MAERIVGPVSFHKAEKLLADLIYKSGAFSGGSYPVVGRLKTSYGYKKVIGVQSFDKKVRTRIDYDPDKGYHFNFENDLTGEKICILIDDLTPSQYEAYIDQLTLGRGLIIGPKRPTIPRTGKKSQVPPGSMQYWIPTNKPIKPSKYSNETFQSLKRFAPTDIVNKLSQTEINEFTLDYLIECYEIYKVEMKEAFEIDEMFNLEDFHPKRTR